MRHQLVGFGDGGTYQDINEEGIQEFFDTYGYLPRKPWHDPWRWILLLGAAIVLAAIVLAATLYITNYGTI